MLSSLYPFGWVHTVVIVVPAILAYKRSLTFPEISEFLATDEALDKSSISNSTGYLVRK